ncbi:MAG: hypothetical protein P4L28_11020 [Paludibacteraceae bacterium]|nr:hypothetical protein [Paludibacteraceae bacterium]
MKLAGAILQIVPVYNVEFMVAWFAKPRQRGLLFQGSFYPENYPGNYPQTTLKTIKKEKRRALKNKQKHPENKCKQLKISDVQTQRRHGEKSFANISCYFLPPKKNTPKKEVIFNRFRVQPVAEL